MSEQRLLKTLADAAESSGQIVPAQRDEFMSYAASFLRAAARRLAVRLANPLAEVARIADTRS